MIAIKDMEITKDCKKCPLMGTDGIDTLSPMMCIAIWATKHEKKHCVSGRVHDDCPLVEIGTCKDCNLYRPDQNKNMRCQVLDFYPNPDFYCAAFEKRGNENG